MARSRYDVCTLGRVFRDLEDRRGEDRRSVSEAFLVLQRIFTWADGGVLPAGAAELAGAALRIGILALLPRIIPESCCPEKKDSAGQTGICTADPASKYYAATVLGFLTAVCLLAAFGSGGGSSFIYFQF